MIWKLHPKKGGDLVEQLLLNIGIKTKEEREKFFNPKILDYREDLEIPNIEKAQKRILDAISKNELIIVFGDYDVDGICASAILYKGLASLGAKVLPYIPHREKEGYGISKIGLDFAKQSDAKLIISVDCGIVAFDQAIYAKELGLDLIITDHHLLSQKLPEAFTIVHSTKMCGAGVAWCLIKDLIPKDLKEELLQFVAIATVCDLIPLKDLGRTFVFEGLKVLNKTKNSGLLSLINLSGINLGEITTYEVGYVIGPRLNAIGRLGHAIDALRLLCTKDLNKAMILAKLLNDKNIERQQITVKALDEAKLMLQKDSKINILYSSKWIAGIIGLIAGKITDEYSRPSIAISVGAEISKGSARSIEGINIVEVIRKHSDILIDIGGHPGAAGFSLLSKNVEIFKKRIEKDSLLLPDIKEKVLDIAAELEVKQLNKTLIKDLEKFEPFGFKNSKPIFATKNIQISEIKTVGNGKHLKFKVSSPRHPESFDFAQGKLREGSIDCIAFGLGELVSNLKNGQVISLAYSPELNTFNGFEKLQLKVKDIRLN